MHDIRYYFLKYIATRRVHLTPVCVSNAIWGDRLFVPTNGVYLKK